MYPAFKAGAGVRKEEGGGKARDQMRLRVTRRTGSSEKKLANMTKLAVVQQQTDSKTSGTYQ